MSIKLPKNKVSVIVPSWNEVKTIEEMLSQIPSDWVDEVLVVDAGSTDGTVELVKKLGYNLIFQEGKGFGAGISSGLKHVNGDILVFVVSDGSQNPRDIPRLLEKLSEGYDVVLASRYLPGAGSEDDNFLHRFGNRLFTFLCNFIYGSHFSDCLYFFSAVRKKVFETIEVTSPGFEYCVEFPIKVHRAGFKIAEIPSFEKKRSADRAKLNALRDGFKILRTIFSLINVKR